MLKQTILPKMVKVFSKLPLNKQQIITNINQYNINYNANIQF